MFRNECGLKVLGLERDAHLALTDEPPERLRDDAAEIIDASLGMLTKARHTKDHPDHPIVPPRGDRKSLILMNYRSVNTLSNRWCPGNAP